MTDTETKVVDFARLSPAHDAEHSAVLKLTHPYDGYILKLDDKPVTIDMLGVDCAKGRRAAAVMVKEIDAGKKNKRTVAAMPISEILEIAGESIEARARFYAAITVGWYGIAYIPDDKFDDEDAVGDILSFSTENAAMLFATRPWVMEQVDAFLGDKANFRRDA